MTTFYLRELRLPKLKNAIKFYLDYQNHNSRPCFIFKLHFFCPESLSAWQYCTGTKISNLTTNILIDSGDWISIRGIAEILIFVYPTTNYIN